MSATTAVRRVFYTSEGARYHYDRQCVGIADVGTVYHRDLSLDLDSQPITDPTARHYGHVILSKLTPCALCVLHRFNFDLQPTDAGNLFTATAGHTFHGATTTAHHRCGCGKTFPGARRSAKDAWMRHVYRVWQDAKVGA